MEALQNLYNNKQSMLMQNGIMILIMNVQNLSFAQFQKLESTSITAEITVKKQYDTDGKIIEAKDDEEQKLQNNEQQLKIQELEDKIMH